jgi:hypothetical protein
MPTGLHGTFTDTSMHYSSSLRGSNFQELIHLILTFIPVFIRGALEGLFNPLRMPGVWFCSSAACLPYHSACSACYSCLVCIICSWLHEISSLEPCFGHKFVNVPIFSSSAVLQPQNPACIERSGFCKKKKEPNCTAE